MGWPVSGRWPWAAGVCGPSSQVLQNQQDLSEPVAVLMCDSTRNVPGWSFLRDVFWIYSGTTAGWEIKHRTACVPSVMRHLPQPFIWQWILWASGFIAFVISQDNEAERFNQIFLLTIKMFLLEKIIFLGLENWSWNVPFIYLACISTWSLLLFCFVFYCKHSLFEVIITMLLIRALLVLSTLCWCILVPACHHSCLMFFMSQCIVKTSFCFAGWVPRLQLDFFSEFSDAISGQMAVTLDLTGAKWYASQI